MRIQYANGRMIEAVLLSRTENTMRVAARGTEDLVELTQVNGAWITDDCEPVTVSFDWQRIQRPAEEITLEDCLCSPELALRLINLLPTDSDEDAPEVTPVNVATAACGRLVV